MCVCVRDVGAFELLIVHKVYMTVCGCLKVVSTLFNAAFALHVSV